MALATLLFVAFVAGCVVWLRFNVVPPNCRAASTLAMVRHSLLEQFKLPASVTMDNIRTEAGGYVGFRFVCEATLDGIDPATLAPGSTVPGSVRYVSQLTDGRQQVSVSIEPRIIWERVQ